MAGKQYPGWTFLLAGLFIGLFMAFLFYLQQQPSVDKPDLQSSLQEAKDKITTLRNEKVEAQKNSNVAKTEFDFYHILPELEVVVPSFDTNNRTKQNNTRDTSIEKNTTPPSTDNTANYLLQVGSFSKPAQAEKFKAKLALLGLLSFVEPVSINNKNWYRVRLGPYQNRQALLLDQQRLNANAIKSIVLQPKD